MIRKAKLTDIPEINSLLKQVLTVHHSLRPDLFLPDSKKYTDAQLAETILDPQTPIFVFADSSGRIIGHAFCQIKDFSGSANMVSHKSLYVDDICVDENCRGQHIAAQLFAFVKAYAKEEGCYNITLNVWEGNDPARRFYESMGMSIQKTTMETTLD